MLGGGTMKGRAVPVRYLIPNLLTTAALCCGLAALHFAIREDWNRALLGIGMSALFDALDGRMARLLRVSSRFGAVLDSLSDFLSFGVAPAILIHLWMHGKHAAGLDERLLLLAVSAFALCAALRLARFTSSIPASIPVSMASGVTPKAPPSPLAGRFFTGMPTPAAAGCVLIPVMLDQSRTFDWKLPAWTVIGWAFLIAWLMISRVPMFSFKKVKVRRALIPPLLLIVGLTVASLALDTWLTFTGVCAVYMLLIPVSVWSYHRAAKESGEAPGHRWTAGPSLREQLRELKEMEEKERV